LVPVLPTLPVTARKVALLRRRAAFGVILIRPIGQIRRISPTVVAPIPVNGSQPRSHS